MKFIKLFESFSISLLRAADPKTLEDKEREAFVHVDTIRDILFEITDDNWDDNPDRFEVNVEAIGPLKDLNDKLSILVSIKRSSGFIRRDIESVIDRIDRYMDSEGFGYQLNKVFDGYTYSCIYRPKGKRL